MDDVYLNDPRQNSAQLIARKQRDLKLKRKKRNFRQYVFDLIVKTLICSGLLAIDFTLFSQAGNYSLFDLHLLPAEDALFVYAGIVVFSAIAVFLTSFSRSLQDLFIGVVVAVLILAIFNQFALFDEKSILYGLFAEYMDSSFSGIFINYSHFIIAGFVALICYLFFYYASRINYIYFLGVVLLILGYTVSSAYLNPGTRIFSQTNAVAPKKTGVAQDTANDKTFVFLGLPNFPSYSDIKGSQSRNYTVNQAIHNLLGFYSVHNFAHYPNAYVGKYTDIFVNMVDSLNLNKEPVENNLLGNAVLGGFWNFKRINEDKLYMEQSALYNQLLKDNYTIKAYQSHGIELCSVNNKLAVNRCTDKINLPVATNHQNLSSLDKAILISAQWLESTGIFSNINIPLKVASYLSNDIAPLNFSSKNLYAVNSPKILDLILEDIQKSSGNNAYFAIVDLPSSTFVYDDFCTLKNPHRWNSSQSISWSGNVTLDVKQQSYAEQLNCLIGTLENFIQELQRSGKLDNTTIILHGLSASPVFSNRSAYLKEFERVGMAVFKPNQKSSKVSYALCPISSVTNTFVNGKECKELHNYETTKLREKKLLQEAHKKTVFDYDAKLAVTRFKEWYQGFAGFHSYSNNFSGKQIAPKKIRRVNTVRTTKVVQDLPAEEKMKPISAAMQETAKQEKKAATAKQEVAPIKKPETVKPQVAPMKALPQKPAEATKPQPAPVVNKEVKANKVDEEKEAATQEEVPESVVIPEQVPETNSEEETAAEALANPEVTAEETLLEEKLEENEAETADEDTAAEVFSQEQETEVELTAETPNIEDEPEGESEIEGESEVEEEVESEDEAEAEIAFEPEAPANIEDNVNEAEEEVAEVKDEATPVVEVMEITEEKVKAIVEAPKPQIVPAQAPKPQATQKPKSAAKPKATTQTVAAPIKPIDHANRFSKPELLKAQYRAKQRQKAAANAAKTTVQEQKVSISVDVTDATETALDVIPPALLGETKYQAAQ